MKRRTNLVAVVIGLALVGTLAGCGKGEESPSAGRSASYAAVRGGPLRLTSGWVSATMSGGGMAGMGSSASMGGGRQSAAYATILNSGSRPDALIGVSTDAAGSVSLHRTVTSADGTAGRMVRVPAATVPAGGRLTLAPGGYHVMLMDLRKSFAVGTSITLTWRFRSGRTLTTAFPVIDPADRPEESGP